MSMFKTIGLITGGAIIGVMSASILSSKGYKMSDNMGDIFNKYKNGPLKDDDSESNQQEKAPSSNVKLSDDAKKILRKSMQVEGIVSEIKEIIYTEELSDIIHKVDELEGIVFEMKSVIKPEPDNEDEDEDEDEFYESEEDMIDRVVEEVIEAENKRVDDIANEIIEKFKDSDNK